MDKEIYMSEVECAPREEMELLQSYRLCRQIRRVYENVKPYREKMDKAGVKPEDIRSVKDLYKLPFTVKQDLRDNYPYGMFATPLSEVVRIHASSGTTGKQTVVGYTQKDIDIWAECAARALARVGGTKNDFVHVSYGYGLFTGGLGMHYGAERLGATTIPASAGNSMRQIQMFQDFGSSIVCMTPSYAISLIELMKENNISKDTLHLKTRWVQSTVSNISPPQWECRYLPHWKSLSKAQAPQVRPPVFPAFQCNDTYIQKTLVQTYLSKVKFHIL